MLIRTTAAELPLLFGTYNPQAGGSTEFEREMSEHMQGKRLIPYLYGCIARICLEGTFTNLSLARSRLVPSLSERPSQGTRASRLEARYCHRPCPALGCQ